MQDRIISHGELAACASERRVSERSIGVLICAGHPWSPLLLVILLPSAVVIRRPVWLR